MTRVDWSFLALIAAQMAHSLEEYRGRLSDDFPPAQLLSSLVSSDRSRGFIILNVAIAMFGIWCFLFPIRRRWPSYATFAWTWIAVEVGNGIVHPLWSLYRIAYTPGVATAPVLFVLALNLAHQLRTQRF